MAADNILPLDLLGLGVLTQSELQETTEDFNPFQQPSGPHQQRMQRSPVPRPTAIDTAGVSAPFEPSSASDSSATSSPYDTPVPSVVRSPVVSNPRRSSYTTASSPGAQLLAAPSPTAEPPSPLVHSDMESDDEKSEMRETEVLDVSEEEVDDVSDEETELAAVADSSTEPLFSHFLILRLEADSTTASIQFAFPRSSTHPPIADFCFIGKSARVRVARADSECFAFVLTNADGRKIFGFACRFVPPGVGPRLPDVMVFLSTNPQPRLFFDLLHILEARWYIHPGAVFPFVEALYGQPFSPGCDIHVRLGPRTIKHQPHLPRARGGEHYIFPTCPALEPNWPLYPLFQALSIDNALLVLSALICEKRMLFTSAKLSKLSECTHAAISLLFPMEWSHVYIPVVPQKLLRYLCAPMPFVMGVLTEFLDEALSMPMASVVVVNLDEDKVYCLDSAQGTTNDPDDEKPFHFPMPQELEFKLARELKWLGAHHLREPSTTSTMSASSLHQKNLRISDAFMSFVVYLIHHAKFDLQHCTFDKSGVPRFRMNAFVSDTQINHSDLFPLVAVVRHSQMFEQLTVWLISQFRLTGDEAKRREQHRFLRLFEKARALPASYSGTVKIANSLSGAREYPTLSQLARKRKVLSKMGAKTAGLAIKGARYVTRRLSASSSSSGAMQLAEQEALLSCLQVTSNSASGSQNKALRDAWSSLRRKSFNSRFTVHLCDVLWVRLQDCKGLNWRHGSRSLALLHYIITHGSDLVVQQFSRTLRLAALREMVSYSHMKKSVAETVQQLARQVLSTLENPFLLRRTRLRARQYVAHEDASSPGLSSIKSVDLYRPTSADTSEQAQDDDTQSLSTPSAILLDLSCFDTPGTPIVAGPTKSDLEEVAHRVNEIDFYRTVSLFEATQPPIPSFAALHPVFAPSTRGGQVDDSQVDGKSAASADPHEEQAQDELSLFVQQFSSMDASSVVCATDLTGTNSSEHQLTGRGSSSSKPSEDFLLDLMSAGASAEPLDLFADLGLP